MILGLSFISYAILGISKTLEIVNLPKSDALGLNIFWYLGILGYGHYLLYKSS